jgi:hypothetical protein
LVFGGGAIAIAYALCVVAIALKKGERETILNMILSYFNRAPG